MIYTLKNTKITLVLLATLCVHIHSIAQQQKRISPAEEQILKAEANRFVESYYNTLAGIIPVLNDSVAVQTEDDRGLTKMQKITVGIQFIDKFFDNHDVYVYNDLSPDDDARRTDRRVMPIEEYLPEMKRLYGDMKREKLTTGVKSVVTMEVGYNSQAAEPFYYAKVSTERKLKGMYLGNYFTDNVKMLDVYVKTLDRPDTRFKTFKIISIDFKSKQVVIDPNKLSVEEATAKGLQFFDKEDFETAFKLLSAKSGDRKFRRNSNATWALGYMYFWGRGTQKNDTEMVKFLEYAADRNNLYALHYLGENYFFGEYGVEENERKGIRMIKEAARKGFPESNYFLGEKYEKGEGNLKADRKDAIRYYQKAAKQGHPKAIAALKRLGVK